jgi:hypothetical protein
MITGQNWRYSPRMTRNNKTAGRRARAKWGKASQPGRSFGPLTRMTRNKGSIRPSRAAGSRTPRPPRIEKVNWRVGAFMKSPDPGHASQLPGQSAFPSPARLPEPLHLAPPDLAAGADRPGAARPLRRGGQGRASRPGARGAALGRAARVAAVPPPYPPVGRPAPAGRDRAGAGAAAGRRRPRRAGLLARRHRAGRPDHDAAVRALELIAREVAPALGWKPLAGSAGDG